MAEIVPPLPLSLTILLSFSANINSFNNRNYTYLANREVRVEGQNPLQKLLRLNRIIREGHQYRVNYSHPQNAFISSPILPRITVSSNIAERGHDPASASEQESPTGLLVPGAGIKLPPEIEDDAMLVEHEADRAFSHKWVRTGIVSIVTVDTAGGKDVVMADGGEDVDADGGEDVDAEGVDDVMS